MGSPPIEHTLKPIEAKLGRKRCHISALPSDLKMPYVQVVRILERNSSTLQRRVLLKLPALAASALRFGRTEPLAVNKQHGEAYRGEINQLIASKMQDGHVPGMAIAIVVAGNPLYLHAYGKANVELNAFVTPASPFKIASLTKPFTSTIVMMLVEEGKIGLDEHLNRYLASMPVQWSEVTVRQALSQTSGVEDYLKSPDWSWRDSWRLQLTPNEVIEMASKAPLRFAPGAAMKYSNTGYYLLGMLIEKVTGQPYGRVLSERIFQPLKMQASRRDTLTGIVLNRVSGYAFENAVLQNAEYTSDTWAFSEGGVLSSISDLAQFDSALYTEKLVKRSTLAEMWTPTKLNSGEMGVIGHNAVGEPNYYGLGWFIGHYRNHKIVFHGGDKPGFSSLFVRFADESLTIIVLANLLSPNLVFSVATGVADLYLSDTKK